MMIDDETRTNAHEIIANMLKSAVENDQILVILAGFCGAMMLVQGIEDAKLISNTVDELIKKLVQRQEVPEGVTKH